MTTVKYSAKQTKELPDQTDWNKINKMKDKDIAYDVDSPDISKLMEEGKLSKVGRPKQQITKPTVTIRLDSFIVSHLRKSGRGWQTRVNDYLSSGIRKGYL